MTLLYSLRIIIISFLLLITNVNLLNAQNTDFSDSKCNFPTGKYYKELSDLASFQSIDVKVNNYKKWVNNSLGIITSAKDHEYTSYLALDDNKIISKINLITKKLEILILFGEFGEELQIIVLLIKNIKKNLML